VVVLRGWPGAEIDFTASLFGIQLSQFGERDVLAGAGSRYAATFSRRRGACRGAAGRGSGTCKTHRREHPRRR